MSHVRREMYFYLYYWILSNRQPKYRIWLLVARPPREALFYSNVAFVMEVILELNVLFVGIIKPIQERIMICSCFLCLGSKILAGCQ